MKNLFLAVTLHAMVAYLKLRSFSESFPKIPLEIFNELRKRAARYIFMEEITKAKLGDYKRSS